MGARNQESKNLKFYALKAKADATTTPQFVVTEKVNDKWEVTGTYSEMFGVITKMEMVQKEYLGVTKNVFKLYMTDENETSVIDLTHNSITYSILNSLASDFDITKQVNISVYKKESEKNEQGQTFWNGRASVTAEGEKLNWAIEISEIPRPEQLFNGKGEPVMTNGKKTFDNSGVLEYWENVFLTRVKPKFGGGESNPVQADPSSTPEPASKAAPTNNVVDEEDDLPF